MSRIGLISNLKSHRNTSDIETIRAVVAHHPRIQHVEIDRVEDLASVLASFAASGVELLVVNGGDGTVQATLTALRNGAAFAVPPRLAILPGGRTNLIAQDVGLPGSRGHALARLAEARPGGQGVAEIRRPILSVTYAPDKPALHGMFFGTAAFHRAVLFSRRQAERFGIARAAMLGAALGVILSRALLRPRGGDPLIRGERLSLGTDGQAPAAPRDYLLLLATTLDRLILGLQPFWGTGEGGLRYTLVEFPPRHLARALLPVLRGRPKPWMAADGYASGRARELTLRMSCPLVLDGQIYRPAPDFPVTLRAGPAVSFLRC